MCIDFTMCRLLCDALSSFCSSLCGVLKFFPTKYDFSACPHPANALYAIIRIHTAATPPSNHFNRYLMKIML